MLIYVIPFVLLLVVAIVLKKREAGKEADKAPKKTAARTKSKATTSKQKAALKNESHVADAPASNQKQVTQLSTELKKQIQDLIRDRNYFAAEAQINQALNKDSSQHELYLLLLDIHLQQKDEFAIGQLFNHLRSLELEDTLAQAEQKKVAYDAEHTSSVETTALQSEASTSSTQSTTQTQTTHSFDFDALIQDTTSKNANEQVASDTTAVADQPLEFKSFSLAPESNEPSPATTEHSAQPLQFSLEDTPLKSADAPTGVPQTEDKPLEKELKDLEFSFNLDPAPKVEGSPEPVAVPAEDTVEDKPEFKFSFDLEQSPTPAETTTQIEEEAPAVLPALSFDLDPSDRAVTTSIPLEIAEPATSVTTVAQDEVNLEDPLVQSFPELGQINESTLNLDLVQQYIQLGSYEAARQLFAESSNNFSAEQQQRAEQLLNQIAS
jgi:FimV-like protein